eukprot:421440-Amphidinium_carterae.1
MSKKFSGLLPASVDTVVSKLFTRYNQRHERVCVPEAQMNPKACSIVRTCRDVFYPCFTKEWCVQVRIERCVELAITPNNQTSDLAAIYLQI